MKEAKTTHHPHPPSGGVGRFDSNGSSGSSKTGISVSGFDVSGSFFVPLVKGTISFPFWVQFYKTFLSVIYKIFIIG